MSSKVFPETLALLGEWGDVLSNPSSEPWPREELVDRAAKATALMLFMPDALDAAFLDACPGLRIVSCAVKGYDNFDVAACTERGVWLTIVPDLLTRPTAELAVGLMIALSRNILQSDHRVRQGNFRGWRPTLYGRSLDGSTVGILGGGSVGKAVAHKLSGFECRTLVHDPVSGSGRLPPNARWVSVDELKRDSDYVLLAMPLGPATLHFVNRDFLEALKAGALLINVARGSLVNESHVAEALRAGQLGGYAADVYEFEDVARPDRPRSVDPDLLAMPERTVLTGHLGSAVRAVRMDIEREAALNIGDALSGRCPRGAVNAAALAAHHAKPGDVRS